MKPWGWVVAGAITAALLAWYAKRGVDRSAMKLRYFSASEFGAYWPLMSIDLLRRLDEFRHQLGYPVEISPAPGAIGRPVIGSGENVESGAEASYHNYVLHGQVMAIDILPKPPNGASTGERQRWVDIARSVGFTGIGLYPDWQPRPGLHLDVRPMSRGRVATWAGVKNENGKQVYVGIERGYV